MTYYKAIGTGCQIDCTRLFLNVVENFVTLHRKTNAKKLIAIWPSLQGFKFDIAYSTSLEKESILPNSIKQVKLSLGKRHTRKFAPFTT